jgi:hypothetical protein
MLHLYNCLRPRLPLAFLFTHCRNCQELGASNRHVDTIIRSNLLFVAHPAWLARFFEALEARMPA